jgi:hypothetical protein
MLRTSIAWAEAGVLLVCTGARLLILIGWLTHAPSLMINLFLAMHAPRSQAGAARIIERHNRLQAARLQALY